MEKFEKKREAVCQLLMSMHKWISLMPENHFESFINGKPFQHSDGLCCYEGWIDEEKENPKHPLFLGLEIRCQIF